MIKVKQGNIRNYVNRLLRTDPDASPIRRRTKPFRPGVLRDDPSLGLFSDEEAFSVVICQYVGGGNTCVCERFAEPDEDRRTLYRHFIPFRGVIARPLEYKTARCPNFFQTDIQPQAEGLDPWWTLAVGNWQDEEAEIEVDLSKCCLPDHVRQLAVFEFHDQKFYGIRSCVESLSVAIPAHGMRLFRLAAWSGETPVLLGTDLHFSGGAELAECRISKRRVSGRIETPWQKHPVNIHFACPTEAGTKVISARLEPGQTDFRMNVNVYA